MYKEVPGLVLYRDLGQDSILYCMADIFEAWEKKTSTKEELVTRIYQQIKRILDVATSYGFNRNLWQDYLAFLLITNENSFTLTCEKVGAGDGSVNAFAKNDYAIFKRLFHLILHRSRRILALTVSQQSRITSHCRRRNRCITRMSVRRCVISATVSARRKVSMRSLLS